eukprot:c12480_g1_i2.p1 GENE.c12480_g1_i2~~c12480_g1_i2.p1  ORF type:complete len:234 (+),score=33.88 c12480_g1_i2:26-727(+)
MWVRRLALAGGLSAGAFSAASLDKRPEPTIAPRSGILAAIGNTPLVKIESLSRETGCTILAKCEHLSPGGSVKDRVALYLIEEAERQGLLVPGEPGTICEGTGGNTGVGIALVASAKGYRSSLAMPDYISPQKIKAMQVFGADIVLCPAAPFTDLKHYYHVASDTAKRLTESGERAVFVNQFENLANMRAHLEGTGAEIWEQTNGKVDAFVSSAGWQSTCFASLNSTTRFWSH